MPEHGQPVGDQGMGRYHHPESLGHDAWLGSRLPYRDRSSYGSCFQAPVERSFTMVLSALFRSVARRCIASFVCGLLVFTAMVFAGGAAEAITAPELRGQRAVQDITADMHGRDLKEKEFLKADLREVNLSETDLRGAVINTSQLQGADLRGADLEDVVAFSSRFDGADLRDANFTNAMLMQSRFTDAEIEGTDFTNAVIDLPQLKALCGRATGVNSRSGLSTRDTLGCR
ncbi:Pentapeptide repeats (8 copies) [Synechococcus sp. MIT S9509]|nr:Pentapeptide repeats (8 copies) [Synechococcus sp. MIT S9509]